MLAPLCDSLHQWGKRLPEKEKLFGNFCNGFGTDDETLLMKQFFAWFRGILDFAIRNLSPERSRMQKDPGRPLAESSELPSISKPNNLQSNQTNSFDVVGLLAPESVNRTANDAEDDLDSMIVKQEEESFEHFAPSSASQGN